MKNNEMKVMINHEEKKLEISGADGKKACQYGTEEYKYLQMVRNDYPNYSVAFIKHSRKKSSCDYHKGLTYAYMRTYIKEHHSEHINDFEALVAKEDGKRAVHYALVRNWFLKTCPEINEYSDEVKAVLGVA